MEPGQILLLFTQV